MNQKENLVFLKMERWQPLKNGKYLFSGSDFEILYLKKMFVPFSLWVPFIQVKIEKGYLLRLGPNFVGSPSLHLKKY